MAIFRHISTKLVLVLDAETAGGKKRKRVTVSNIREDVSAEALRELAAALGKVLAHPVARLLLYTEEALEREDAEGEAAENGGVRKEAEADAAARTGGRREAGKIALAEGGASLPAFAQSGGALSGKKAAARADGKHAAGLGKHRRLAPCLPESAAANVRPPPCFFRNRGGV